MSGSDQIAGEHVAAGGHRAHHDAGPPLTPAGNPPDQSHNKNYGFKQKKIGYPINSYLGKIN